ncbi:MAG: LamG domain-containing protein, partial [Planctomycetes bacterium]|nr:LamG domain-containing protein [Planctomycetota bacterium]
GGSQSLPLAYDNSVGYSEATMTLTSPRDWTVNNIGILTIWFRGDPTNAAERMYVALNGSAVVSNDNPAAAQISAWSQWDIDLQAFADQGVNLANVNTISLGFGDKSNPQAGGPGMVFFDDIRLYPPEQEPEPEADPSLVIYYSFDEVGDIVADQSGKGHDGVVVGDVTANADGVNGGAANFANGGFLDLDGPSFPAEDIPTSAMTLAAWIKIANTGGDHEIFNARASDESWIMHPEPKSSGDIRWLLRSYGGATIFQIRAGTVTWDEWLHFAGTYDKDSGKAALYINGELIEEMDVASPADIAGDWDLGARVGKTIDDARPFTGLMDELRMYTRALSQDEILEIMQGM